jgi:thioredoxin-like negative regulator of GroEL
MIEPLLQAERLLVHGQVDAAERIYASTIAADPRNAIAVVGLARVALERGDDRLAYEHACAALQIDRQNAAALRLEARLSEVLATRGESVERPQWLRTKSGTAIDAGPEASERRGLLRRILGR